MLVCLPMSVTLLCLDAREQYCTRSSNFIVFSRAKSRVPAVAGTAVVSPIACLWQGLNLGVASHRNRLTGVDQQRSERLRTR